MTSKLIVNSLAADTGVSTITFADQAKMGNAIFHSTGFTIGDSFLHSTGVNITNINATGVITATKFVGEVSVGSSITFEDNEKAYFGTGTDFSIYHNGSASYLDETGTGGLIVKTDTAFQVFNSAGSQAAFTVTPGGVVEIYHGSTKRIETDSLGINVLGRLDVSGTGANDHLNVDSNTTRLRIGGYADLQLFHDNTNINYISNHNDVDLHIVSTYGGSPVKTQAKFIHNSGVELYFNDSKKLQTETNGIYVAGNARIPDGYQLRLGNDNDAQVYHSGNNAFFLNSTGYTRITASSGSLYLDGNNVHIRSGDGGETQAVFNDNGAAELYHNNTKRLETFDNNPYVGVSVTNDLVLNGAGDVAIRWAVGGNAGSNFKWGMYYAHSDGALRLFDNVNSRTVSVWKNTGAIELNYQANKRLETTNAGVEVNGNLKFTTAGNGIDFSATGDGSGSMSSELLDDYEEGSFTPTSNASLSDLGGRYTKIGRQVTVHVRCTVAANSSSNQMNIAGFPYAAAMDSSLSNGSVPASFGYIGGSVINGGIQIHMNYNQAQTHFYNFGTAMTQQQFSGRHIRFGIVYYTS
mgnify:CR=1 FL=1